MTEPVREAEIDALLARHGFDVKIKTAPADLLVRLGRLVLKAAFVSAATGEPCSFTRAFESEAGGAPTMSVSVKARS
jgi:hypothetical protein